MKPELSHIVYYDIVKNGKIVFESYPQHFYGSEMTYLKSWIEAEKTKTHYRPSGKKVNFKIWKCAWRRVK